MDQFTFTLTKTDETGQESTVKTVTGDAEDVALIGRNALLNIAPRKPRKPRGPKAELAGQESVDSVFA